MSHHRTVLALILTLTLSLASIALTGCLPDFGDHSACVPQGEVPSERLLTLQWAGTPLPERIPFEKVSEDQGLIEGDIRINLPAPAQAQSIVTVGRIWNSTDIPYRLGADFPQKDRVRDAIRAWEERSGGRLRFRKIEEGTSLPADFIDFVVEDGCWSYVGRVGGAQKLSLADNCSTRAATHELGHALGLWHEQSRADRDDYVSIKWCNIQTGKEDNFRKRAQWAQDFGAYDYQSIMHYPSGAFTKNGRNTIQSTTSTAVLPWSRRKISDGDWAAVARLYGL